MRPSLPWRSLRSGSSKLKRRLASPRRALSPFAVRVWAVTCCSRCGSCLIWKKSLSSMAKHSLEKSWPPLAAANRAASTSRRAAISRAVSDSVVSATPDTQQASCTR